MSAPTDRMRELERLLRRLRRANDAGAHFDLWEHGGASSASPAERAAMEAEATAAAREGAATRAALEALVAETRRVAPAELVAWADAHLAYLAAYLEDRAAQGEPDGDLALLAERERAQWAEVRSGARAFVESPLHDRGSEERYRRLFGIDPSTLEPVD